MKNQIEMSFDGARSFRPTFRRQRRQRRAHWWFQQMRHVVDRALDRTPIVPHSRPEQTYLTLPRRSSGCEPAELL